MHVVDHVFVLLLVLVQPVYGAVAFRRYRARIASGQAANRRQMYIETLTLQWLALAGLVLAWVILERPAARLGLIMPYGGGFWIGACAVLILAAFLVRSQRSARRMSDLEKAGHRDSFGELVHFLPQTDREFRYFVGLSMTAGIVEELLYRGFLLWYLSLHAPLWAAVLLSSIAFGLAHSYQGISGFVRTGLVGFAFAILYVVSGSIWLPIIAHALVDILQGAMILELLRHDRPTASPRDAPTG